MNMSDFSVIYLSLFFCVFSILKRFLCSICSIRFWNSSRLSLGCLFLTSSKMASSCSSSVVIVLAGRDSLILSMDFYLCLRIYGVR